MTAAIAHWRDTLGFEVDWVHGDPPVHARVSAGDRTSPTAVRIRLVPFEGGGARRDRGYFWIHVGKDLDGLFAKYVAAGVEVVAELEQALAARGG